MEEKTEKSETKRPNTKVLMSLIDYLEQSKKDLEQKGESALSRDISWIFEDLRRNLAPGFIEPGLEIMQGGTNFIQNQIEELERLLLFLNSRDPIYNYITHVEDNELADIIYSSLNSIPTIPGLSNDFLWENFDKYIEKRKKRRLTEEFNEVPENIEDFLEKPAEHDEEYARTFDERMNSYYLEIKEMLPAAITQILSIADNEKDYYMNFVYLLHLIYKGYVSYDDVKGLIIDSRKD